MVGQEGFERVAQKQRTRNALLQATRELLAEGRQPTVPEAADRAGISRATAYRYFSTPEGMAQEAILDAIAGQIERLDLGDAIAGASPADRVERVVSVVLGMVLRNEALFRSYLGLVVGQETTETRRGGRRLRWLSDVLAPLAGQLPAADFQRLINGLSLVTGIETLVVLRDVCGLDDAAIDSTARWIARTLVLSLVAGGTAGGQGLPR